MKSIKYNWLLFTCLLLIALCFLIACAPNVATNSSPVSPEKITPASVEGTVTDVVDGNIIKVMITGTAHTVRYIGIYTLVPYQHSKALEYYVEECYKKNSELVNNKAVRFEKDISEADKSGHLLRYVWVGDMMVNAELVRQGYAMVLGSPPDIKYYDMLVKLQKEAQSEGRGLWSEEKEQPGNTLAPGTLVGSMVSKIYHYASCPLVSNIREKDRVIFLSANSALARGYGPCEVCKTLARIGGEESTTTGTTMPSGSGERWPEEIKKK